MVISFKSVEKQKRRACCRSYIRMNGEKGGDTLFYCVIVDGNECRADTIFGLPRADLVCSDPNREDLKGLKYAIHPRLNDKSKNIIF